MGEKSEYLLEITDLVKEFKIRKTFGGKDKNANSKIVAVNHSSLRIRKGEIYGLVGESGCGKSTFGRCVLQLIPPTSGSIKYEGRELAGLSGKKLRPYRKKMQIVFQNPYASLNPKMKIRSALKEVLRHFGIASGREEEDIIATLNMVGLEKEVLDKYPHQFSGGQLQRIAIARALLVEPELLIADEPVSALDVSIQAQVLNILRDLNRIIHLTMLFVSHDLSVVQYLCDKVAVIYNGVIVEDGTIDDLYNHTGHPYTRALLSAVPVPDPEVEANEIEILSDSNEMAGEQKGCVYYSRCPQRSDRCREKIDPVTVNGHMCRCILAGESVCNHGGKRG